MSRRIARHASALIAAAAVAAAITGCGSGGSSSTTSSTPRATATGPAAAVQSSRVLAVEFLRRLRPAEANSVFSPYSVEAALTMAHLGAAGRTARQMNRVLRTPAADRLAASNATLANRLAADTRPPSTASQGSASAGRNAAQLNVANSLWVQSGHALRPSFTSALARDFASESRTLDFRAAAEPARRKINAWVSDHTAGRIRNLMPPSSITPETRLVLANAVYLKAHWATPFAPRATQPGPFFTPGGRTRAAFMGLTTELRYARTGSYQALDVPYALSTLSMLVVMPPRGALPGFQRRLTPGVLAGIERSLKSRRIQLRMPKFHVLAHDDLVPALSALGMPVAFSDRADFSGITTEVPLKIGAVQHAADLRVDEQGTIAAAATGLSMGATSAVPQPAVDVTLDHPFLLFLRDDATGAILFAGRITDPTRG